MKFIQVSLADKRAGTPHQISGRKLKKYTEKTEKIETLGN